MMPGWRSTSPGAHLLNRASRCRLWLCSAVCLSTIADSRRTPLLASVMGGLQSDPANSQTRKHAVRSSIAARAARPVSSDNISVGKPELN